MERQFSICSGELERTDSTLSKSLVQSPIRYTPRAFTISLQSFIGDMRNIRLTLLTLALALFAFACADQTTQPTASNNTAAPDASPAASVDEFADAKARYAKLCTDCHGPNGDGGEVQVDDRKLKVPSLKEGHALTHSDQQLVKQVLDGGEGMPAFKDKVSTAEAAELVRLIRKSFQAK